MSREQISQNLRGRIGLEFLTPPTGLEVAAGLIPAHQNLSDRGFTASAAYPFARTNNGVSLAMGVGEGGQPRFPDRLGSLDYFIFQLRDIVLSEVANGGAAPLAPEIANVEVTGYSCRRQRTPYLTLGGFAGKLVIGPDLLTLGSTNLAQDLDSQARVLTAAKQAAQIVADTLVEQLADFNPVPLAR